MATAERPADLTRCKALEGKAGRKRMARRRIPNATPETAHVAKPKGRSGPAAPQKPDRATLKKILAEAREARLAEEAALPPKPAPPTPPVADPDHPATAHIPKPEAKAPEAVSNPDHPTWQEQAIEFARMARQECIARDGERALIKSYRETYILLVKHLQHRLKCQSCKDSALCAEGKSTLQIARDAHVAIRKVDPDFPK